jgi:DnaK suppressor protein
MHAPFDMSITASKTRMVRGRLEARRFALLARYQSELERADEETAVRAAEVVEAATEQWDARVLLEMSEMDADALASVIGALRRLDEGTYGTCIACGHRIEPKRLEALPEAVACRHCISARARSADPFGTVRTMWPMR